MGIESFFSKKPTAPEAHTESEHAPHTDMSRRAFLNGLGATAFVAAITPSDVYAGNAEKKVSAEAKRENIRKICAYEQSLKDNNTVFEEGSKAEMFRALRTDARFDNKYLVGTLFDARPWFKEITSDSWPAVQAWNSKDGQLPRLQFAHQDNESLTSVNQGGYGNAFFVNGIFISNRHIVETPERTADRCLELDGSADIVGLNMLTRKEKFEPRLYDVQTVDLVFPQEKTDENLHGKLVHIPSIHEQRGKQNRGDNTTVTSAVLVQITPHMLITNENKEGLFDMTGDNKEYKDTLLRSYFALIPSSDTNDDGEVNALDVKGISGSPVFLESDHAAGNKCPSGIVWGTGMLKDEETGETYSVVFIHGPDVLGAMIEKVLAST